MLISSPTTLPYFCDAAKLPVALLSSSEIETATLILPTIRDPRFGRIVLVKGCFVVKHGVQVTENEGHALLFLENHPLIPAPQLYAMYREGDNLYLVMGLMPGKQLGLLWHDLSEGEKLHIIEQLRSIWDSLRSIPAQNITDVLQDRNRLPGGHGGRGKQRR